MLFRSPCFGCTFAIVGEKSPDHVMVIDPNGVGGVGGVGGKNKLSAVMLTGLEDD